MLHIHTLCMMWTAWTSIATHQFSKLCVFLFLTKTWQICTVSSVNLESSQALCPHNDTCSNEAVRTTFDFMFVVFTEHNLFSPCLPKCTYHQLTICFTTKLVTIILLLLWYIIKHWASGFEMFWNTCKYKILYKYVKHFYHIVVTLDIYHFSTNWSNCDWVYCASHVFWFTHEFVVQMNEITWRLSNWFFFFFFFITTYVVTIRNTCTSMQLYCILKFLVVFQFCMVWTAQ